jgi:hypothetical protein
MHKKGTYLYFKCDSLRFLYPIKSFSWDFDIFNDFGICKAT